MGEAFAGDKKASRWLLREVEARYVRAWVRRVPRGLESQHLTLLTLAWSAGVLGIGFLAQRDARLLWGISLFVGLQYLTDVLDGAVGRLRGTGLVRWGYYMDHFVDFVFMGAVFFSWALVLPGPFRLLVFALFVMCGAFTTHAHLTFAVTNEFHIAHFNVGATELRVVFVAANSLAAVFGPTVLEWLLPVGAAILLVGLVVVVSRTQRSIWQLDMRAKAEQERRNGAILPCHASAVARRATTSLLTVGAR